MPSIENVTGFITSTNASNKSVVDCELYPEPRGSFNFRVAGLFCIMLMSLVGNGLVCRGALKRRQRPFSYYLVTNLAVAELLFTAVQPFYFVYNTKPYSWVFGSFMCHVVDPLMICTNLVITFTLAAIAVYRCVMMLQPHRYRGSSTSVAYKVIAASWIWGIVLSLPDSTTRTIVHHEECDLLFCENPAGLSGYRTTIFILNFVVPFITMVLSYSCVIFRVKKHIVKTRHKTTELYSNESLGYGTRLSILSTDAPAVHHPQAQDNEPNEPTQNDQPVPILGSSADAQPKTPSKKMMRLEADVLNMIYLIILLFFLCYLPSNLLFILTEGFGLQSIKRWSHYWLMLWYLDLVHMVPSALHPICYGASSRVLGLFFRCHFIRRWFKK